MKLTTNRIVSSAAYISRLYLEAREIELESFAAHFIGHLETVPAFLIEKAKNTGGL